MIFDHKNFVKDMKRVTWKGFVSKLLSPVRKMKTRIFEDDPVTCEETSVK